MGRRPRPLKWLTTDFGSLPDCCSCTDHVLSPLLTEAIASCAIENGSSIPDLTRRYVEHYHASGHKEAL